MGGDFERQYLGCWREDRVSTLERLALRYHVQAELFDRGLSGEWSRREPDCWLPYDMSLSGGRARLIRGDLADEAEARGYSRSELFRAIREASSMSFAEQKRRLNAG